MTGRPFGLLFTVVDRNPGIPAIELERAREQGETDDSRWLVGRNNTLYWAEGR